MIRFLVYLRSSLAGAYFQNFSWFRLLSAAVIASLLSISGANATPQMRFIEGSTTFTIVDQDSNDRDTRAGVIDFSGMIGTFNTVIGIGATTPHIGSPTSPEIDLLSLEISGASGGTLQVMLTETDFIGDGTADQVISGIGGTTNGTILFETFASSSNAAFATDILLSSSGVMNGLSFSFEDIATLALTGAYSLTTVITITHASGGLNSSFNAAIEISEPALSPALLIGAMAVMATMMRRRSKA